MSVNGNKKPDAELLDKALLKARKQKGMTQEQVAAILCVLAKAVSKWECCQGIPDISLYDSILENPGVNVYDYCLAEAEEIAEIGEEGFGVGKVAEAPVYNVDGYGGFLFEAEGSVLSEELKVYNDVVLLEG